MRLLFSFTLLFSGVVAAAQMTEEIETDRPDQTETPYLVPKNYFQAEFGLNAETYRGGFRQLVHPTSLLKYGLSNNIELRMETTVITEYLPYIPANQKATAMQPLEVGTKLRLFEEKGPLPKTSLIVHVGLPFAAGKRFRSDAPFYTARLSLQNSLSKNISLGYNIGMEKNGDERPAFFYTVAPGFSLSEKWYAYVEAFGAFSNHAPEHNLDGGIAYLISQNTKVDFSAGFGLGGSSLQHYFALGFSFRLPLKRH